MPLSFELLRTANVGSFFLVMLGSWTPAPFFDESAADLFCSLSLAGCRRRGRALVRLMTRRGPARGSIEQHGLPS